ncbi:S-locus lectin protein kinase family protein [Striga asiatica]|uniref:non-specific serine/threonine protein kinase n=1 Tax=Striga asiatica TaxID=4170 RepID=A0A5A7PH96_STRAF|nr:S-locus lectin protein kinase family protein [Striga asiatica]
MNLTDDVITGRRVRTSSWRNPSDPAVGDFTAGLQARNIPQIFTWRNGIPFYRSGPWNGLILIGVQDMYSPYLDGFQVGNDSGNYYFNVPPGQLLMKIDVNSTGSLVQTLWTEQTRSWDIVWVAPQNPCDLYATCGPFGLCDPLRSPICSCLQGFEPANQAEWANGNWTSGCTRRAGLGCGPDRFLRMPNMKVPDFAERVPGRVEEDCRVGCLGNCSCLGYSHDTNIGCMFWRETLVDIQQFNGVGAVMYVRLAASEFDESHGRRLVIIIPLVVGGVALILIIVLLGWWWMAKKKGKKGKGIIIKDQKTVETFQPDSTAIVLKDESEQLANGKEIAVKRLSAASGQGMQEFRNEAVVISKVQHRNLVKLVGCCVEREEKMLVYEYMPNKSLDFCLFDSTHPSQKILDWEKRFSIIEGIGRGLLYLHRDSRLKIIHRDLKPSNVLLDEEWNPKISDFGMARIFGGNQDQASTARVVGTYGYMAPEYAMEGRFSEKSDVYSFGAWKLWNEDNGMAFADHSVANPDFQSDIVRCIHIALLCVQEFPKDRPTVQTVLSMLSREIVDLPLPEQPVFAERWDRSHAGSTHPTFGCNPNDVSPCRCLQGFSPNNGPEWASGNWSSGCVRRVPLGCESLANGSRPDGFLKLEMMKMSGYSSRWTGPRSECRARCLANCSCVAYTYAGLGCLFWSGSLMDTQKFPDESGSDLYVRVANSELDFKKDSTKIIVSSVVVGFVVMSVCVGISWKCLANKRGRKRMRDLENTDILSKFNLEELPLFEFEVLSRATNEFSDANKLGKGGFGPVYKGVLSNGREIAVKRLSKASGQGMEEFMNEVLLISKLQHKNLVRLLGCSIENKEKMLIYEYMPNKSLDVILFDTSQEVLDWGKRFNIIHGICRGLLYLHRDSRLKIIHRDLKPSNILLDNNWNPKISDFGMARILGGKQDHVNTIRVVGTYGYMAPEYAIEGRFSEKSDVFSFGVLMLEIASGRKNTSFYSHEVSSNLLGHVWKMWKEGNVGDVIDRRISSHRVDIVRCIHIGLLCVQELPQDRPSISFVLSMLRSEIIDLPEPKQSAFVLNSTRSSTGTSSTQQSQKSSSISLNNVTLTMVDGR